MDISALPRVDHRPSPLPRFAPSTTPSRASTIVILLVAPPILSLPLSSSGLYQGRRQRTHSPAEGRSLDAPGHVDHLANLIDAKTWNGGRVSLEISSLVISGKAPGRGEFFGLWARVDDFEGQRRGFSPVSLGLTKGRLESDE
ncbi:hypothetical protein KM043_002139 [Ampulex compressa]|nr:hypothetical protein KM043_002139 [Ampulex compressa]